VAGGVQRYFIKPNVLASTQGTSGKPLAIVVLSLLLH